MGEDYKNGYIVVNSEDKYGVIGFDKKVVIEPKYDEIKGVSGEGLYVIKENDKYIVVNKSGEKVLNKSYNDIISINKEYIIAVDNGKCGVVDIHGATKIPFNYDNLIYTNGTDYIAKTGDKYGIMSVDGSTKLNSDATSISYVSSGNFYIADYMENGKVTSKIYDSNYEAKVTGIVSEVNASKGYIRVHTDNDYKYYNFKFEEKSSSQVLTTNILFLSKKDGKYGFIDKTGKVVIDYIYDDATEQNSSGYAGIKKDGVWGSIDINGKVVSQPTYNLDNNTKIDFIGSWHLCEDPNANYYIDV